jgi:hypothetical protein
MTTLVEYAEKNFPNHEMLTPDGDQPLGQHTAIAHIVGDDAARAAAARLRDALPSAQVSLLIVKPTLPSVLPQGGEDKDSVADLPKRRVAASGIVGGVVAGLVIGLIVGFVATWWAGLIVGVFAALLVGAWSAIAGGASRYAGQRAWEQSNAPATPIGLVAAFMDDEAQATRAAAVLEGIGVPEVRIVAADGAWHSPNT